MILLLKADCLDSPQSGSFLSGCSRDWPGGAGAEEEEEEDDGDEEDGGDPRPPPKPPRPPKPPWTAETPPTARPLAAASADDSSALSWKTQPATHC